MFIEHIERLRCTSAHDETWLIATFIDVEDRFIRRGSLGCYLCSREFQIEQGIALFKNAAGDARIDSILPGGDSIAEGSITDDSTAEDFTASVGAMGIAAFLNPAERSTVVLMGAWCRFANELPEVLPHKVFAVNPGNSVNNAIYSSESAAGKPGEPDELQSSILSTSYAIHESEDVSIIIADPGEGIPLARGSVSGVAIDNANANQATLDGALRVLMPGGRLVAPASVSIPPGITELARDASFWVAEKNRDLVMLSR